MGCETAGLAGLITTTLTGRPPAMLLLAALLFVTGLGQGTLVQMVTGRIAPQFSGMIAGVTSAALQISTALSVAVIGGIFYSMLGNDNSGACSVS